MAVNVLVAGGQCVAKCNHLKLKPGEIAYHKGDILTIVETTQDRGIYKAYNNKTGEEGLVSCGNMREREAIRIDSCLSLMPWFHGKISGPQAVKKLKPREDGLFLVRESIRHPGDYVLCVSFAGEVIHYRVIYQDNKLTIDKSQFFHNLIDMIEFYSKNTGAIATILHRAKEKEGIRSAELELSKTGWLLDMDKLILGASIGEGEFGEVYKGEYMGQQVAVKNIKCDVTAQAFLSETAVMTKLQHKNLVRLLGVILQNGLYIVTELMDKKFSTRSDVWSYGILLWETFSYGRQPYPKMSLKEVRERVEQGYRMEAPEDCPPALYQLMRGCWQDEPGKRPSFHKLRDKLQKEMDQLDPPAES
ncbi:megakaryocyte-associated tyrosine-protein kinase isoform X3 [Alosa pseudoharengus]|uniref:megakaryocyte-associated tyrosine-protein kinase isoform X3 n=1 Tax=Alosa pseudoharengus TaxID=34774 RepID=UPI003F89E822